MRGRSAETFPGYLESLPDDLLECISEDYVWLADWIFHGEPAAAEFSRRRECCRRECLRRGELQLFQTAEASVRPRAA